MQKLDEAYNALLRLLASKHIPEYGVMRNGQLYSVFRFKDAYSISQNPDHQGKYVMQERRRGCREPFNHWGFMADKQPPVFPLHADKG